MDSDSLRESDFRPNQPDSIPPQASMKKIRSRPFQQPRLGARHTGKTGFRRPQRAKGHAALEDFCAPGLAGFFVALVWMALHRGTPASDATVPHTAVVEIKGEIAAGADASAEFVNAALRAAFEDDGAKAVVLLINSPGGSPVQAGMMNDEILRLKAKHKKPVYAVVEETCASAAYYIAVSADKILRRQGQHRRQHRRADGRLRFHRPDGQAGRGAPPADRRREQGLPGPVQPAKRKAARVCPDHAGPDPPAVHRGGEEPAAASA